MQPEFKNVSFMEELLKDELLLMRITGEDRPGLTAGIMQILAKFGPTEGLNFDHYVTDWDFD